MELTKLEKIEVDGLPIVLNKTNAISIATTLKQKVFEDGVSASKLCEKFKFIAEVYESFNDRDIIGAVRDEISQHGKQMVTSDGNIITPGEKNTYDYSHDPIWRKYQEQEEYYKKLRESREKLLKLTPAPNIFRNIKAEQDLDPDSGELFDRLPPTVSKSTEFFKVSFKA